MYHWFRSHSLTDPLHILRKFIQCEHVSWVRVRPACQNLQPFQDTGWHSKTYTKTIITSISLTTRPLNKGDVAVCRSGTFLSWARRRQLLCDWNYVPLLEGQAGSTRLISRNQFLASAAVLVELLTLQEASTGPPVYNRTHELSKCNWTVSNFARTNAGWKFGSLQKTSGYWIPLRRLTCLDMGCWTWQAAACHSIWNTPLSQFHRATLGVCHTRARSTSKSY